MTQYAQKYSSDDLFDMFANQADSVELFAMPQSQMVQRLQELAPDMEDASQVAAIIKHKAQSESSAKINSRLRKRFNLIKW